MPFRVSRLKRALEQTHHCSATHAGSRVIVERLPDGGLWRGLVEAFDLAGHPTADRGYAWLEQRGNRTVCVTRLKAPPVRSAQAAVRAEFARRTHEVRPRNRAEAPSSATYTPEKASPRTV